MIDLLKKFLYYDPQRRIQASEALQHPFFSEDKRRPRDEEGLLLFRKENTKRPRMEEIDAIDLLTAPSAPLQVCPDWDMFHHQHHHPYTVSTTPTTTITQTSVKATTTKNNNSMALIPFQHHLDTVAHYGKQLTTWQHQQSKNYKVSHHTTTTHNNSHKRPGTLYNNHYTSRSSTINTIPLSYPTLTTTTTAVTATHALADSLSSTSSNSDER